MQIPDKTGPIDNIVADSTEKTKETIFCTFCAERADGYNDEGQATCNIPGNHDNWNYVAVTFIPAQ